MKRSLIALISVFSIITLGVVCLQADDDEFRMTPPSKELVKKLTETIRKHCPDAKFEVTTESFIAKHGTMMFTVHGHSMGGEVDEKTHQQEGPNFKGFLLKVSLEDGLYAGQAGAPQTLREPYWQRFFDVPSTDDGKQYHRINFSYGSSLDPKLKQAIFDAIPKTKRPNANP